MNLCHRKSSQTFHDVLEKLKISPVSLRKDLDFEKLKPNLLVLNNPMKINVEIQLPKFHLELCELQSDHMLLAKKTENQGS